MKLSQFDEWLDYHTLAFPAIKAWLLELGDDGNDTRALWAKTLADIEFQDAKTATERLLAGDEDEPKGASKTPTVIRAISKRLAVARRGGPRSPYLTCGVQTFKCPDCEDTGEVLVWSLDSVEAAKEGKLYDKRHNPKGDKFATRALAACDCGAVSRIRGLVTIDRREMPLWYKYREFTHPDGKPGLELVDRYEALMEFLSSAATLF